MILSWDGPAPAAVRSESEIVEPTDRELRERYDAYRARQARRLLGMMPREAVRPLYRRALRGMDAASLGEDPMMRLVEFCETLLPLPPFEVWVSDVRRNPGAHLLDLQDAADAPSALAPATLEARRLDRKGSSWVARLRGYRDHDAWRGFIAFEDASAGTVHSTAIIFRERDASALRERFLSFESATLEAFLRSSLP